MRTLLLCSLFLALTAPVLAGRARFAGAAALAQTGHERLAQLAGLELTRGGWLCAEADGRLTAAISLERGTFLAEPSRADRAMRRTLELWAAQISGQRHGLRQRLRLA